jgi:hypothetical protein
MIYGSDKINLSDNISLLFQIPPNQKLIFPPPPKDPNFFLDLKNHLQKNEEYRKERKEFYKLHPAWSLYRARDEFAREYSQTFLKDIEWFVRSHPDMTAGEAAQEFCRKYRGYSVIYGLEFVQRAIERL